MIYFNFYAEGMNKKILWRIVCVIKNICDFLLLLKMLTLQTIGGSYDIC